MFLVRICLIWVNQREYARPTPPQHRVRGLASGLLAFHSKLALYKRNCYSEHGRVELSNSSYVNTRPEPAQTHFMCCMARVSGTGEAGRELWDVNEPNPGCLVRGCRSRTGPPGYPLTAGAFLVPVARMHGTPGTVSDKPLTTTCTLSR